MVHGDRLDELPLDGSGVIYDVSADGVERRTVSAVDVGLAAAPTEAFGGGTGEENAALIVAIFEGEEAGAKHDIVALNAGAALVVAGQADDLRSGVELAAETIASGAARGQLERLRASATEANAD